MLTHLTTRTHYSRTCRSGLSPQERAAVELELGHLEMAVGACERMSRQPIPLAYTRHTSRFIIVFLTFLPFALWPYLLWLTAPATAMLAFLLVGIENIGVQLEQPLDVLPLHRFCCATRKSVEAVAEDAVWAASRAAAAGVCEAPWKNHAEGMV
jgi:predicted membrane chloride channel (bestrophin family)